MKPDFQPGQWLIMNDDPNCKAFVVGKNAEGQWVIEWKDGDTSVDADLEDWHHEPACTSWQWQPEKWPKYFCGTRWSSKYDAFVRFDRPGFRGIWVKSDGKESQHHWTYEDAKRDAEYVCWIEITESEALARIVKPIEVVADKAAIDPALKALRDIAALHGIDTEGMQPQEIADAIIAMNSEKASASITYTYLSPDTKKLMGEVDPPQPAEDPDEWVIITDPEHVIRPCDQISDYGTQWYPPSDLTRAVGKAKKDCGFNLARCRRRDLPPLPLPVPKPATRTVTLYEWVCWSDNGYEVIEWRAYEPKQWPNRHRTETPPQTIEVPV